MACRPLTETLMAMDLVAKGKSHKQAAELCGIHVATLYRAIANQKKRKNLATLSNNLANSGAPLDYSHDATIITPSTTQTE